MQNRKQKIEQVLTRGVEKIYPSKKALRNLLLSSKKLRIYQGFDPSMPDLHIGHTAGILKLKQFQDLGHEVIFLVGDFTGMIGDPTDKGSVRKKLTREQVLKNSENWKEQAGRFLNFSGKNKAKIMFNSKWNDKLSFRELIEITSNFTVQRMLERDFFQKRIENKKPIFLHEFLYPIAQAIDCVKMDVDLEIGGNDQTFNMLAGRHLMKALKDKEKLVLTIKLLVDKKGRKVGKTAGNALFLNASPDEMYGGVMAFPDEAIIPGLELLTTMPSEKIAEHERNLKKVKINPVIIKKILAFEIVKANYGVKAAKQSKIEFEKVFKKKGLPRNIPEIKIKERSVNILNLLVRTKLALSKSEAKRLILQRGIKIDRKVQSDWKKNVKIKKGQVLQAGKRKFIKIV